MDCDIWEPWVQNSSTIHQMLTLSLTLLISKMGLQGPNEVVNTQGARCLTQRETRTACCQLLVLWTLTNPSASSSEKQTQGHELASVRALGGTSCTSSQSPTLRCTEFREIVAVILPRPKWGATPRVTPEPTDAGRQAVADSSAHAQSYQHGS